MAAEIEIKLKGLKELKQQLGELESQLATATDPKQMQELSSEAGKLRSEIKAANTQLEVMSSTDPFKQASNSFGIMSEQLANLDFKGAANSANLFAKSVKSITPEALGGKLKSLGSTVLSLGKAFMSLGISLLTNPIFLIAAAIVGIVTVIGILLNKLGLLKPILKAIGQAFEFLMAVIDAVVQSIKDFLDWLGLTSFAAEESAERQAKAQEKVAQAYADKQKKITTAYDQEIRLAQIAGEKTFDLERKKQEAIIETSRQQYKALEAQRDALRAAGLLTAEESKKINDQMRALREGIQQAKRDIQVINAQEVQDNKKKNEEVEKAEKESYKRRIEEAKKYAEERKNIQQQIRDLEISLLEEGFVREVEAVNERYNRVREDVAKNEKLTSEEKKRLLELYAIEEQKARAEISNKYAPTLEDSATILPPPEIISEKADELVKILDEKFGAKEVFAGLRRNFSENFQKSFDGTLGAADSMFKGMSAMAEAFAGDSEKSAKKAFEIQKAANIAQAVMDTYKGAVGAFTQAASTYPAPLGLILGAASAAATVAMGVANIKKISSQKFGDKSGNVSKTGSSGSTSTQAMQPDVNLFGQNNNANTFGSSQSVEQGGTMVLKAVVSETEITSTQNKINKMKLSAEL